MGRASNAKKAARLARENGTVADRPKRKLGYPLAVVAAVVVGVIVVVLARQPAETPTPTLDVPSADVAADGSTTDSTVTGETLVPGAEVVDPTTTIAAP